MRWRIDKMNTTEEGGSRPHYHDETRRKASQCLLIGFMIWCAFIVVAIAFRMLGTR
jgi:hypothetical protein